MLDFELNLFGHESNSLLLMRRTSRRARQESKLASAWNDCVNMSVLSEPPFHLTRRGWGEFPVRIQIHFKDPRNKRIDIIHQLKVRHHQSAGFFPLN